MKTPTYLLITILIAASTACSDKTVGSRKYVKKKLNQRYLTCSAYH